MLAHVAMKTGQYRSTVVAKVEDWLSKKVTLKILKMVNSCGGQTFVDDKREQLRIVFPQIQSATNDPSIVLGLILDKESGWQLVGFSYDKNNPAKSELKSLVYDIGFDEPVNLASKLFTCIKDMDEETCGIKELAAMIQLSVKLSSPDLSNT